MNEAKKNIQSAYEMLSRLQASGDVIDLLAAVRTALREAIKALEEMEKDSERTETEEGR